MLGSGRLRGTLQLILSNGGMMEIGTDLCYNGVDNRAWLYEVTEKNT